MLPKLKGDPCWILTCGPFYLADRRIFREESEGRKFKRIRRDNIFYYVEFGD